MDSTHASSSTSTRASPSTSSANLIALSQEISRLGTIFNEQEFTQKEMAELRKFFTVEATQRKDILDLISTLTDDREKLNYLKEFLTEQRDADKDDLKSLIENIEGKLGDIYELSSRLEISRTQGSHYASKFEAFDLFGLIRLALPRKKLPFDNTIYDAQANLLFFRANKLANFIYEQGMRKKLEESIKYIRTLSSDKNYNKNLHALAERADFALKNFAKYEGTAKSSEKRLYLASTPELSIMLMTAYVLDAKISIENNQAPFNCRLDVDLRGRTTGTNIANITVELGEIKSSNTSTAIKKGYRQLLLRLAVLSYVIEACSNESFNFNLFGKIYVPKTDPNFQIPPEWKKGYITFSNSANYYIEVITIGEKQ